MHMMMALQDGNAFYDLFFTECILCEKQNYFLFDITMFFKTKDDISKEAKEELKEEVYRGKEFLNTAGFNSLARAITKKDMIDEEHTKEYFELRDQFDLAGEASIILKEEGLL